MMLPHKLDHQAFHNEERCLQGWQSCGPAVPIEPHTVVMQAGSVESRAGAVTEGGVQGQGYQLGMTPSSAGALAITLHLLAC